MENVNYRARFPLVAMGIIALMTAMWAGLIRLGWDWPPLRPTLPMNHGPLMIGGFLGTVIGIERAVALSTLPQLGSRLWWVYIGPLLSGIGALILIIGVPGSIGPILITLGSLNLAFVFGVIMRMQPALFTITMAAGALLWLVGNTLWLMGGPVYTVVSWWSGFLILTIAGERVELGRILRPSRITLTLFVSANGLFLLGLIISLFRLEIGVQLAGAGLIALALWLLRYDVARYTVKKTGLPRYMAVCLLTGYGWMAAGGILGLIFGGITAGPYYDAMQHTVFVGFVMSMIFAHAPIIFPAITGKVINFDPSFYSHLALLHLSLLVRVTGDLTLWLPARQWGGLFNVIAILLFIANTGRAILRSAK